jgi:y4mF family transcriptional regulator
VANPRKTQPQRDGSMPELARIGRQVSARRIELHLTQQTLADLAGVSRSSLQSLEYGSGSVKLASVVEIADALGLQLELKTPSTARGR